MNSHRSLSCCFAIAVVFSSILEYATPCPCIGHAETKITMIHTVAASRKIPPGRTRKAGMASRSKIDSSRRSQPFRTISSMFAGETYNSAFLSEVRNGLQSDGRYCNILIRTPRSFNSRRRGLLRDASVVVPAKGSIWGGMNLMDFAMIVKNSDVEDIAGEICYFMILFKKGQEIGGLQGQASSLSVQPEADGDNKRLTFDNTAGIAPGQRILGEAREVDDRDGTIDAALHHVILTWPPCSAVVVDQMIVVFLTNGANFDHLHSSVPD